jgi:hypothetical protein
MIAIVIVIAYEGLIVNIHCYCICINCAIVLSFDQQARPTSNVTLKPIRLYMFRLL